jgi:hypothetical protein
MIISRRPMNVIFNRDCSELKRTAPSKSSWKVHRQVGFVIVGEQWKEVRYGYQHHRYDKRLRTYMTRYLTQRGHCEGA